MTQGFTCDDAVLRHIEHVISKSDIILAANNDNSYPRKNTMSHELPDLGYAYDALEPHIDARTMEIHHSKHHNAYVAGLNGALDGNDDLQGVSVEALIQNLDKGPAETTHSWASLLAPADASQSSDSTFGSTLTTSTTRTVAPTTLRHSGMSSTGMWLQKTSPLQSAAAVGADAARPFERSIQRGLPFGIPRFLFDWSLIGHGIRTNTYSLRSLFILLPSNRLCRRISKTDTHDVTRSFKDIDRQF